MNSNLIMILAVFTLGAGLLWGIMSWLRAKKAQDHHEGAAVAERQRTEGNVSPSDEEPASRTWSKERGANPPTPEAAPSESPPATPPRY